MSMLTSVKNSLKESIIIRMITYLILGILLLISPDKVVNLTIYILSIYLFLASIINFYQAYNLKKKLGNTSLELYFGIFQLIVAIIIFFFSRYILAFFPIVIGILLIINGGIQLASNIGTKMFFGIIYSLLLLVIGFIILVNPFGTVLTLTRFLGCWFIIMVISEIILYFKLREN